MLGKSEATKIIPNVWGFWMVMNPMGSQIFTKTNPLEQKKNTHRKKKSPGKTLTSSYTSPVSPLLIVRRHVAERRCVGGAWAAVWAAAWVAALWAWATWPGFKVPMPQEMERNDFETNPVVEDRVFFQMFYKKYLKKTLPISTELS